MQIRVFAGNAFLEHYLLEPAMKKNIHPKYQQVLFVDSATGHRFVCGSTLQSAQTETFQGVEYPVVPVSTSSASHPFFTGSKQLVDAEGRVDKFNKRFKNHIRKDASSGDSQQQHQAQSEQEQPKEEPKEEPKKEQKPKVEAKKPAKKAPARK